MVGDSESKECTHYANIVIDVVFQNPYLLYDVHFMSQDPIHDGVCSIRCVQSTVELNDPLKEKGDIFPCHGWVGRKL